MKIKKNDLVYILSGKDKGKTAKVLRAIPGENKVLVEGVNIKKVHQRAKKEGKKGEIIERALPIDVSNVAIIDPKSKKPTRVGMKLSEGKYIRIAKKSGSALD